MQTSTSVVMLVLSAVSVYINAHPMAEQCVIVYVDANPVAAPASAGTMTTSGAMQAINVGAAGNTTANTQPAIDDAMGGAFEPFDMDSCKY